jgi:hypothetical protein
MEEMEQENRQLRLAKQAKFCKVKVKCVVCVNTHTRVCVRVCVAKQAKILHSQTCTFTLYCHCMLFFSLIFASTKQALEASEYAHQVEDGEVGGGERRV